MEIIHGGDIYFDGKPDTGLIDFSVNVNPLGMPERVKRAAERAVGWCACYPDPLCRELRAGLSALHGVPQEDILCGNGAADLIYRLAFALRPKQGLVLAPTFSEYELALSAAGCAVRHHCLREDRGFMLGEEILEEIDEGLDVFFFCNPNNPTGIPTERGLVKKIIERCEKCGVYLLLDECFYEFIGPEEGFTALPLLAESPHLILLRAFTKMYAMAGLRLGYALCTNRAVLTKMEQMGQPWGVSIPAQNAGIAALSEPDYPEKTRKVLAPEREYLRSGLEGLGLGVYPSRANFLLFRWPGEEQLAKKLRAQGILLRTCGNFRGLSPDFYRISVRTHPENERLLAAIAQCRQGG